MREEKKPVYVQLSTINRQKIRWFWKHVIGPGILTVIEGDPNVGKSSLAMHIAAQFSVGGELPNSPKLTRMRTVYITFEDSPSHTIRPRIEANGGNPEMIYVQINLSIFNEQGLQELKDLLEEKSPRLIIIDPLNSFLDPSMSATEQPSPIRRGVGQESIVNRLSSIGSPSCSSM